MTFFEKKYIFSFTLISLLSNLFFLTVICVLVYFFDKINKELINTTLNFNLFQLKMNEKFNALGSEVELLKSNNTILMEKLNLAQTLPVTNPSFTVKVGSFSNNSDEYQIFVIKIIAIVIGIIIVSTLLYILTTSVYSWFYSGFIGKLLIVADSLGKQLLNNLGLVSQKSIIFYDDLGNTFKILLSEGNQRADVYIKTLGSSDYITIAEYVVTSIGEKGSLNFEINALRATIAAFNTNSNGVTSINSDVIISANTNFLDSSTIEASTSLVTAEADLASRAVEGILSLF